MTNIVILPGDGIGPEVTDAAEHVLSAVTEQFSLSVRTERHPFGGAGIDATGDPLPKTTRDACLSADAVLLGAVGGPKWDALAREGGPRPEQGLLGLREAMGLYANLRPSRLFPSLEDASPLRRDIIEGTDILVVRELTGGVYFGNRTEGNEHALDHMPYSRSEVERVARVAFEAARGRKGRVTSVDKANVLATSRLWRQVTEDVAKDYPDVALDHALVDAMAMHLVTAPSRYDVILTENLFGDILSDELSAVVGSIGLAPSASLGTPGKPGLFEPIHGSAPDIAGSGQANPAGTILSLAMLLRFAMNEDKAAQTIEAAVELTLVNGYRTTDLGGDASTARFTDEVIKNLAS